MSTLAAGIAAAGSVASSLISNSNAAGMNEDQRNWQENENQRNREFAERMYTQYQSPQAIVSQLRDAGVNPFVGDSISAGSPNSAPSGSPSMVSPPPFDIGVNAYLQARQLENQTKSVNMDSDLKAVETAKALVREFGDDVGRNYLNSYFAEKYGYFGGSSRAGQDVDNIISIGRANALTANVQADLTDRYGEKKALAYLDQTYQWINESAARIGRLIKENEVSDQEIKKMASEIFRNNKAALLDIAKTMTENQMREWLVSSLQAESSQKESMSRIVGYQEQEEKSSFISRSGVRDYQESQEGQDRRSFDYKMSKEGNYLKSLGHSVMEEIPIGSFNTSSSHFDSRHYGDRYYENYINNR